MHNSTQIVLAGDSAGGGMIVSILVILRDRGLPLPAGAILLSPWVDLTHSFPSVAGDGSKDYIPVHGFMQRPSLAWPPPDADELRQLRHMARNSFPRLNASVSSSRMAPEAAKQDVLQETQVESQDPSHAGESKKCFDNRADDKKGITGPTPGQELSVLIDGELVQIKDQIQMYTTNQLINHPLVSPVLQPSLGGLPPLMVMVGGGEVLRDEQIYLAHKAANPRAFPPSNGYLDQIPGAREELKKWKGTKVNLQVWDDLCHVAPTLSFTRPAKYMYRSIAQFGAWALATAQKTDIEIQDDDEISIISTESHDAESTEAETRPHRSRENITLDEDDPTRTGQIYRVGAANQSVPVFKDNMARQRVDRHGNVYRLAAPSELPALQMPADEIGVIKPGPVGKWLKAKSDWDRKYSSLKKKIQEQRAKEMSKEFRRFGEDEIPPPSTLAGRLGAQMPREGKKSRSWGLSLWSLWGSSHDEDTIEREEKVDREVETSTINNDHATVGTRVSNEINSNLGNSSSRSLSKSKTRSQAAEVSSRSRSRRKTITYTDQDGSDADPAIDENTSASTIAQKQRSKANDKAYENEATLPGSIGGKHHETSDHNALVLEPFQHTVIKEDGNGVLHKAGPSQELPGEDEARRQKGSDPAVQSYGNGDSKNDPVQQRRKEQHERPRIDRFETAQESL